MDIVNLYRQLEEGELESPDADSPINFYCPEDAFGLLDEPEHASSYYERSLRNQRYLSRPRSNEWLFTDDDNVVNALTSGVIIPCPIELYTYYPDGSDTIHPLSTYVYNEVSNYKSNFDLTSDDAVIELSLIWTVELPDGYSALVIPPVNYRDNRFTVFPHVIDADEYPQKIRVPLMIHDDTVRIQPGTPLVQLIPIRRSDYACKLTTGTFTESEFADIES